MKTKPAYLLLLLTFLSGCDKEEQPCLIEDTVIQNVAETSYDHQGRTDSRLNFVYTFDHQKRLTQVRTTSQKVSGWVQVDTYSYDSSGRIIEIEKETTYSNSAKDIKYDVFEYNPLGQVTVKYTYYLHMFGNWEKEEIHRVEYTYASAKQLESSKKYFRNELVETKEYTYTNGLMTGVKVVELVEGQAQAIIYDVEIRYDDKKPPYVDSEAYLATKLDWGYPHQHNIVSFTVTFPDGTFDSSRSYNMYYTYSDLGYPVTVRRIYQQGNMPVRDWAYMYTCQ